MATKIEAYKAKDGKLFETKKEAEAHNKKVDDNTERITWLNFASAIGLLPPC